MTSNASSESLQLVHYFGGEWYRRHFDYTTDKANNRYVTFLMYLNDVKEISSKKKPNSLTEDQLENLSYYEIVSKFINFDNMDLIFPTETKNERNTNYRKDLWSSIGCTILERKRYTLKKLDFSQNNEDDVEDLEFLEEDEDDLDIEDA